MVYRIKRFGRLPHIPDRRDYAPDDLRVVSGDARKEFKKLTTEPKKLGIKVDNEEYDTPIEDQTNYGSCVSFSACGALEYLHNMLYGKHLRFSKFYMYKMIRLMHHWGDQDTGAWVRSAFIILRKTGALQDEYWPYHDENFYRNPAWEGDFADDYEVLKYFRLDYPNTTKDGILSRIKTYLTNKFPVVAGFYCFETIDSNYANTTGNIPYPATNEANVGGHAVTVLGYDDNRVIKNPMDGSETTGAFKFRNSWGTGWGDHGYGYLPYDYLMKEEPYLLADEFYSFTKAEWLESWHP